MTFRASYFTVQPQIYRPWDPAQPNYLVTVLSTVPPQRYFIPAPESRPAVSTPPRDFPFPNLVLLGVPPQPRISRLTFEHPPPPLSPPADYSFPNIALLNLAQLQVKPVGAAVDETVPVAWRPREFFAPNLLLIQPVAAAPFANAIFDRPQRVAQQPDFLAPNLLTTTLFATLVPGAAVWGPWPQLPAKPSEFLPSNLILTAAPVVKPPFVVVFERLLPLWKAQDFQAPNIVVTAAPPTVSPRISAPVGDRPSVPQLLPDFAFPNLALAPTTFVFRPPLISWPPPLVRTQDPVLPNLVVRAPAAAAPPFVPIFERAVAVTHPVDAPLPNLLTSTLAVVSAKPPFNQIVERPPAVPRPQDALLPNLLTTTLTTPVAKPPFAPLFERPVVVLHPIDAPLPNLLTTTLAVVVNPSTAIWGPEPLAPPPRPDILFPNLLTTTLFAPVGAPFRPNPFLFTDRPQPPAPPWDHPPVNFLPLRPPPVVTVELHQNPFFITMGRLSQLGNLPS